MTGRWRDLLPVRCIRRFTAISGYDRALGLAAQAFLAVIPTLVVVAAATEQSSDAFSRTLIARFGLTGSTAEVVQEALHPPETVSASLWGGVLLVVSGVGFARALQRTYRAAWGIRPAPGLRGWGAGMAGVVALAAGVVLCAALSSLLFDGSGPAALLFVLRAVASGALWLLAARLLLGGTVTARQLLPGAVIAGAGQALIWLVSGIWIPRAMASQAAALGVIGVCAVLITWMLLLGLLVVLAAVVAAELSPGTHLAPAPAGVSGDSAGPPHARLAGAAVPGGGPDSPATGEEPAPGRPEA